MCGIFAFFSADKTAVKSVLTRQARIIDTIQLRGPDKTSVVESENFVAIHTLLSITGLLREQPVVNGRFLLLYNGEIYNDYEHYHSTYGDRDFLMARIQEEGEGALRGLDGEFAISLYKFESNTLFLATDPFGTKPLYYQLNHDSCVVGSYESTVAACSQSSPICQVPANTLLTISLTDFTIQGQSIIRPFDFHSPTMTSFERWNEAFGEALQKRTLTGKRRCFVSFSSGHDSGLIAAELMERHIPFHVYTMPFKEDGDVLEARLRILRENHVECDVLAPSQLEIEEMKQFIFEHCDPFQLINLESSFQNFSNPDMRYLSGYIASAVIHEKARNTHRLISLSGQGADEIFSDYYNPHANPVMSELKGNWDQIHGPWKNFYGGWNRIFLGGGERIAGLFGIETRYPFLDFQAVQEFLNLHAKLKGQFYKSPITNRLGELGFPYHLKKYGFAGFPSPEESHEPPENLEPSPRIQISTLPTGV